MRGERQFGPPVNRLGCSGQCVSVAESRATVMQNKDTKRLHSAALEMAIALQRFHDNYNHLGPYPGGSVWRLIIHDCFASLSKATGQANDWSRGG